MAVRKEIGLIDLLRVRQNGLAGSYCGIPDPHCLIEARGHDPVTSGRKTGRIHSVRVTSEHGNALVCSNIPHSCGSIFSSGDHLEAVFRKIETTHFVGVPPESHIRCAVLDIANEDYKPVINASKAIVFIR
jgi:hypothetical protein